MAGRIIALQALSGLPSSQPPVALFTWGFEYTWRVAGLQAWELACGSTETWHRAHLALYETHQPDLIFYEGGGGGPANPELLSETPDNWLVRDGNSLAEYEINKTSYTMRQAGSGRKDCDALGTIRSKADADALIPEFTGLGDLYLGGLTRLIADLGDRCLPLPHTSPAYIRACYAFGFEPAMMAMMFEAELFFHVCDRYAAGDDLWMQQLASAGADAVFVADGWASADVISPALFDRFALPYQQSIIAAAHRAGLKVILWNEGDILPMLSQEATLECDAFACEQPRKGHPVTIEAVRTAFGPGRCLFGNLDSEELLLRGSRADIERAVQAQLAQSGPHSPFIHCTGSPLPSNVAPQTVDLMIAAART